MIKMFAWESRIEDRISAKREVELQALWKRRVAELAANLSGIFLPTLTMMASIGIYTVVQKQTLTAAKGACESRISDNRADWQCSPVRLSFEAVGSQTTLTPPASLLFDLLKSQIGLVSARSRHK